MSHVEHNHTCQECKTVSKDAHKEHGHWICTQCKAKNADRATAEEESGQVRRENLHNQHDDARISHHVHPHPE